MIVQIKVRRYSNEADIPAALPAGEPVFAQDTEKLFIGTGTGRSEIAGGGGAAVSSVAGRTGDVVLDETDITGLTSDLSALAAAIASEAGTRASVDGGIESDLSTESVTRASADTVLQTNINAKQDSLGFTPENSANKDQNSGYAGLTSGGLLKAAEFPTPTTSTFGGVKDVLAVTNKFVNAVTNGIAQLKTWITGTPATGSLAKFSGADTITNGDLTGDVATSGDLTATIAIGAVTDAKGSLAVKPSCTLVADSNKALTGVQTIDGQLGVAAQTLVLCTAQSTGSENGPWIMQVGAWTRPSWYPSGGTTQAIQFATTFIRLGTLYKGSTWRQTTAAPVTIDTNITAWAQTAMVLSAASIANGVSGSGAVLLATSPTLGTPSITGALTFNGSSSGTATLTAPAVAGTIANPFLLSNSLQLPSSTGIGFNGDVGLSRASAATMNLGNGTPGNTTGTLILQTLTASGSVTVGAGNGFVWSGRCKLTSPSDGVVLLSNQAISDFTRLQLGGTTTSFPGFSRSGTAVIQTLANGTAGGSFGAGGMTPVGIGTPTQIYNTAAAGQTASMSATTMFTVGAADANFKAHFYIGQLNAGTGCLGAGSVAINVTYTDPITGNAYTVSVPLKTSGGVAFSTTIPLTSGTPAVANTGSAELRIRAKAATVISFTTTYAAGASCSTGQAYNIYPDLEAL